MKKISCLVLTLSFTFLLLVTAAMAVPELINYQGKLLESGVAVTNVTVSMRFEIFTDEFATGGLPVWSETQEVFVSEGVYSVKLGVVQSLELALFDGDQYWLEVTVDTETLSPRQQLTSTLFALKSATAEDAETLNGYSPSDFALVGHSHDLGTLSGTVVDSQIPAAIARDSEITWVNLAGIPAGFLDGIDDSSGGDITAVLAGTGLSGGGDSGDVNLQLQLPLYLEHASIVGNEATIQGYNTGVGFGLFGLSHSNVGVYGESSTAVGILGYSLDKAGVSGINGSWGNEGKLGTENYGVWGKSNTSYAGYFDGDTRVIDELHVDDNVGIGTTAPEEKLDIRGNAKIISSEPQLILNDTSYDGSRIRIRFLNNHAVFDSDDEREQAYSFYSIFSKGRMNDALIRVFGHAKDTWGNYLGLTHDGTDGIISTDTGSIILRPANGRVVWDPQTSYYSVSPAAFGPIKDNIEYPTGFPASYNNSGAELTAGFGVQTYVAPVNLPHQSQVIKVTAYFNDEWTIPATLNLQACNLTSSTINTMATINSSNSNPAVVDDTIESATIDNSNYQYFFILELETVALRGIVIEYTTTSPY